MNLLKGVLDSTSGFTFTDNRVDIALTLPDSLELPVLPASTLTQSYWECIATTVTACKKCCSFFPHASP